MLKKIFLLLFVVSAILQAQDYSMRLIKSNSDDYPYLHSSVQAFYRGGEPVTGLSDSNFTVLFDSSPVDSLGIQTYEEAGLGLDILLCLDLSGSMRGKPLQIMKDAVLQFIDELRDIDRLAVLGYADSVILVADFTNNKDYLRKMIDGIKAGGSQTALYYGCSKGLDRLMNEGEKAGKILVVMGDGKNESKVESYTEADVILKAAGESIPIFAIGYTRVDPVYLQSLEKMAESTGGNYYYSPGDAALKEQYGILYRQILNIYLLHYFVNAAGDGAEHSIIVQSDIGGVRKTVEGKVRVPVTGELLTEEGTIIEGIPNWAIYAAAGVAVLLLLLAVILAVSGSRRRMREEQKAIEQERRFFHQQLEDEKKRRENIEKNIEEVKENISKQESIKNESIETKEQEQKHDPVDREKTVILRPGAEEISAGRIKMEIKTGALAGKVYFINREGASIGKSDDNTIVLPENTVSRQHAKIDYLRDSFYLVDLLSSNGTFLNGQRIKNGVIQNGDVFKIGRVEGVFTFHPADTK